MAEDLAEYERWREFLHDIGTFEVKHGVPVSVTNLYSDEIGNAKLPSETRRPSGNVAPMYAGRRLALHCLVLGAIIAAFVLSSAQTDTLGLACPRQKHRCAAV